MGQFYKIILRFLKTELNLNKITKLLDIRLFFDKKTSNFDNIAPLVYILRKSLDKSLQHFDKIPQLFEFIRLLTCQKNLKRK
jgi:CRISPR/Cas system endoribonuclease Cas6 (RAMP superfamily)